MEDLTKEALMKKLTRCEVRVVEVNEIIQTLEFVRNGKRYSAKVNKKTSMVENIEHLFGYKEDKRVGFYDLMAFLVHSNTPLAY